MKTLIINGSPRKSGDTVALLTELKKHLNGEIIEISPVFDKVSMCTNCEACTKTGSCIIKDDMEIVYEDDFDNVVIASPLYASDMTPPMASFYSRFNWTYNKIRYLGEPTNLKEKTGVLILVGGGEGGPSIALKRAERIFKKLNAACSEDNRVFSLNTNKTKAKDDIEALNKIKQIAINLNKEDL